MWLPVAGCMALRCAVDGDAAVVGHSPTNGLPERLGLGYNFGNGCDRPNKRNCSVIAQFAQWTALGEISPVEL